MFKQTFIDIIELILNIVGLQVERKEQHFFKGKYLEKLVGNYLIMI